MENSDSEKIGKVTFKQDCTGEENLEDDTPVRLGARISKLSGDQYSIQLFDSDPMDMTPLEKKECLGSWFTNRKDSVRFFNQSIDTVSLKGDNSIGGKYLGLVNKDTQELEGCCEIKVSKV